MKLKIALMVSIFGVLSPAAWSAEICVANSPAFICQTPDGNYAIEVSASQNVTGIANTTNSFCTQGYLKLNGHEINGGRGTAVDPDALGLSSVDAITSATRMRVANPATHRFIWPVTVIHYVLKTAVQGSDRGTVFIYANEQNEQFEADLYLYNGDKVAGYRGLSCK